MSWITVNCENQSSLSDQEVTKICRALSIQGTHHIAKAWDLAPVSVQPRPRFSADWNLLFLENSDQSGALGYHDDRSGTPVMKVFVADCERYGVSPSSCASHELGEAMADPDIIRTTIDEAHNKLWALEIGDPCQSFTYEVEGVEVQDFVTPAWFNPSDPGRKSWRGKIGQPFAVPSGGYAQYLDLSNPSQGWHSIGQELGEGNLDARPKLVRARR